VTNSSIPIAIVGAGCHFAGGRDLENFFRFLLGGGNAISDLPADRYDASLYYDPKHGTPGKSYCWKGAMLEGIATPPVPSPPLMAERLDLLQKLALGVAAETFASGGLTPGQLVGRNIPVILGLSRPNVRVLDHSFAHAIEELVMPLGETMAGDPRSHDVQAAVVRAVRERYSPGSDEPWPSSSGRQVAGLVANAFGLIGRHAVVDAACASTFAALSIGRHALEHRTADMVLVGGASTFDPYTLVLFAQSRALTADGSFPFDARASGFIPGEGAGMFLLERLEDALKSGKRVLGVLRAVGASCDGAGRATWSPRKEGQILAIERAYAGGHVDPAEVTLIEAHATSTRLGDATEVAALADFFGRNPRRRPLLIGSVKGNIGHALQAAGAAGLAKVLGAFRHGVIPPSIGYATPNRDIQWDRSSQQPVTEPTPWPDEERPRVAALDSFGIGGLNYHVVVEGPPSPARAEELLRRSLAPSRSQVAIVGSGVFLAGARNGDEFEKVVASGSGQFRRIPHERVALDVYYQPGAAAPWRTYAAEAAVADAPEPDIRQLRIPPKLVANYDPLQFMVLDAANQALAGLKNRDAIDRQRVGVFVGSSEVSDFYVELTLAVRLPEVTRLVDSALDAHGIEPKERARVLADFEERARLLMPALTEESSASQLSGLSSRTARALDIHGPVFTIDSGGTGSSLAALEVGVDALRSGECDIAIVGGADRALRIARLAEACQRGELAGGPSAEGYLPGEGAAIIALKRLEDAMAAGDAVQATITAIGSSATGDLARVLSPGSQGVERAIEHAIERAEVAPADVEYLVSDVLTAGDAPDLVALERYYGDVAREPLPLGSALPLFGHCNGATGIVSLQIGLVAERRREAPPNRSPQRDAWRGHVQLVGEPRPLRGEGKIAITSTGGCGTHYHVIVAPYAREAARRGVLEPIVFRGASRAALWTALQQVRAGDLGRYAPGDVTGAGPVAVALSAVGLNERLEVALSALTASEGAFVGQGVSIAEHAVPSTSCFLYPGLGSPYEGMLRAIVEVYPTAARRLAEIDALVGPIAGRTVSDVLAREPSLVGTTVEWAQYASLTANLVTHEVAAAHGLTPSFVSGHSFGEYAALVVAGALSLEDAVRMSAIRAHCIARETRSGAMTSVFGGRERVARLVEGLPGFAAVSNVNSPDEVVVSGDLEGTAALLERCRRESVHARQLTVPAPFHCELLRPACKPFAREITQIPIGRPRIRIISSVTSTEIADPEEIRRSLVEQLVKPVDFISQIEYAYGLGTRRFIETGAGNVLARLAAKILGPRPAVALSFDERRKREKGGLGAVENALAVLRAAQPTDDRSASVPALPPHAAATPGAMSASYGDPSAVYTAEEWEALSRQPEWLSFWQQARPSLALFARDLYTRSRASSPSLAAGTSPLGADPKPGAAARPQVKVDDASARRSQRAAPPPMPSTASLPRAARDSLGQVSSSQKSSSPSSNTIAVDRERLAEEVSVMLTELVMKRTGYPRDLVRFEQELEADLGIDTVMQVELLGTIRELFELPSDESVTVADLPTLAHLRDYVVAQVVGHAPAATSRGDRAGSAIVPMASDDASLVDEVSQFLIELVMKRTGYPRELIRFDQELEADLGIDTVKQVELLGAVREHLELPADELITVADLPTLAQLRDYVVRQLGGRGPGSGTAQSGERSTRGTSDSNDEDASSTEEEPFGERIDVTTLPGAVPEGR
jgi:acyl transferase domain-containing protein